MGVALHLPQVQQDLELDPQAYRPPDPRQALVYICVAAQQQCLLFIKKQT